MNIDDQRSIFVIAPNFDAGLTRAILYLGAVATSGFSIDGDAGGALQRWELIIFDDVDILPLELLRQCQGLGEPRSYGTVQHAGRANAPISCKPSSALQQSRDATI